MNKQDDMTFSQRNGYEAVPVTLALEELPQKARVAIWNVLYSTQDVTSVVDIITVGDHFVGEERRVDKSLVNVMQDFHTHHEGQPADEWQGALDAVRFDLKTRILNNPFQHVFDLVEFIMRNSWCPPDVVNRMNAAFKSCNLAYVIDPGPPATIFPAVTSEEGCILLRASDDLRSEGMENALVHLRNASKHIAAHDWADSVRESIHAVESVARQIDPSTSNKLSSALNSIEKRGVLQHPALKEALIKLYGYTSNEEGIRHALLNKPEANVTIDEAVFMLGVCASFASYLSRKNLAANPAATP